MVPVSPGAWQEELSVTYERMRHQQSRPQPLQQVCGVNLNTDQQVAFIRTYKHKDIWGHLFTLGMKLVSLGNELIRHTIGIHEIPSSL